jgi:hypothetical protein
LPTIRRRRDNGDDRISQDSKVERCAAFLVELEK